MTEREALTIELTDARERRNDALCGGQPELAEILSAHISHLHQHLARPDISFMPLRPTILAYRDALSECSTGVLCHRPLSELADIATMVIEDTHAGSADIDDDLSPRMQRILTVRAREWNLTQKAQEDPPRGTVLNDGSDDPDGMPTLAWTRAITN